MGELFRDQGVSCNIITIAGTQCKLETLGLVADLSGGVVDIVSAKVRCLFSFLSNLFKSLFFCSKDLGTNFSVILADDLVATKVELKMLCHKVVSINMLKILSQCFCRV